MALDLKIGDTLLFDVTFEYQGPYYTGVKIRCCIGRRIAGIFDEILYKEVSLNVPETPSWATYAETVAVPITSAISPGTGYDLYTKLANIPGPDLLWEEDNAINIISLVPEEAEFRNLSVSYQKA